MIERDFKVDLLKTIAVLCVITIHVTSYGWSLFTAGTFPWVANMFWASATRAAVPIFLMCSGAIFLDPRRELPIKKLYVRYLPRVVAAMLVWAMAYKVVHLISGGAFSGAGLLQALKETLVFNQEFHLYYIHIIIFVYICLPVLRLITANASKRQLEYCLALWFVFGILYPTVGGFRPLTLITGFPRQWMLNMTLAAMGYLVLGHYIRYVSALRRRHYLAILAAGFLFVFFGTWIMCVRRGQFYEGFLGGMSVGVALMAAGIFGVCPEKARRKSAGPDDCRGVSGGFPGAAVTYCSKASFCVYLAHVFFMRFFERIGFAVGSFAPILSAPLVTLAIFICSGAVYAVMSRIPIVKEWLV